MGLRDTLSVLLVVLIWSFNYSINKFAVGSLPPFLLLTVRYVLLIAITAPLLRRLECPFSRVFWIAMTLGVLHFGLFFYGLRGVNAGLAGLILQTAVPFGAILGRLLFGEHFGALQMVGTGVAFGGVYFTLGRPEMAASAPHVLIMLAAALAFAVSTVLVRRLGPVNPLRLNAWVFLLSAPPTFLLMLIFEDHHWQAAMDAGWQAWAAAAFTGVSGLVVGYSLWYRLLAAHPVNRVVPYVLLVPALGILLAGVVLDEPLTPGILGGGALTIGGVALIQFGQSRRKEATP